MYTSIVILVVIASVLTCLIVLVQESKGGGLAADYTNSNQVLGAPKTTNFIEKATWTLAAAMIVLSVLSVAFLPKTTGSGSVMEAPALEQKATNPNNLPGITQPSATEAPAETPAEAPAETPAN